MIIILLGSFFASLAYSFYFRIAPAVDAKAYDIIAQNIAAGNGYREGFGGDIALDNAITRVGPLYEFTLAGIYKIFGPGYEFIWLGQALLHALSAWFIYLAVFLIFAQNEQKKKIALWAAGIFAFYPDLIEISAMLLTETLSLFFVCLFFYVFFYYFSRSSSWPLALALGLVFGLAVLARPPALFLTPAIIFFFWHKKKRLALAWFLIAMFLVFAPWTTRNYRLYGEIMPFGVGGSYNFWIGNWHGGDGEQGPQPFHEAFVASHQIKEIDGEAMRQFKLFLREHPAEFLKLTALRVNKYFSVIRPMGFWFYQTGLSQFIFILSSALASVFLFIFGLAGIIKGLLQKDEKLNYLLALLFFTPLIIFITVVETRYRFQIYPLLAIFASFYLVEFFKIKRPGKYFFTALAVISANGLIDFILSWDKFKDRITPFF